MDQEWAGLSFIKNAQGVCGLSRPAPPEERELRDWGELCGGPRPESHGRGVIGGRFSESNAVGTGGGAGLRQPLPLRCCLGKREPRAKKARPVPASEGPSPTSRLQGSHSVRHIGVGCPLRRERGGRRGGEEDGEGGGCFWFV